MHLFIYKVVFEFSIQIILTVLQTNLRKKILYINLVINLMAMGISVVENAQ